MTGAPSELPLVAASWEVDDQGDRVARFPEARWLLEAREIDARGAGTAARRSPDGAEALLVVLGGTHDLSAGGGSWIRRGVRGTPFEPGRPVAVYLPPSTPYRVENGSGVVLVVAVRQPPPPAADTPREGLARKPLLSLAGSGKAFDPLSGTWKEAEAFPSSPQALLPRAIERIAVPGGVVVERIAGGDYKALGLCVDECLLQAGQQLAATPPRVARPDHPEEIALRVETDGEALVGGRLLRAADGPVVLSCPGTRPPTVAAREGRCHALFVYAGPKGG